MPWNVNKKLWRNKTKKKNNSKEAGHKFHYRPSPTPNIQNRTSEIKTNKRTQVIHYFNREDNNTDEECLFFGNLQMIFVKIFDFLFQFRIHTSVRSVFSSWEGLNDIDSRYLRCLKIDRQVWKYFNKYLRTIVNDFLKKENKRKKS